jgi:4-amino-4-deoxy-L-arabinose transferase-like glycosyltransferase
MDANSIGKSREQRIEKRADMWKHLLRGSLLKTLSLNARLSRLDSTPPIRSCAIEEGDIQIPLWSVPLILLVLYVCLFSGLGALGLVGPDEPRYAAIARAMAETHDWITPRLWGTPWFEKPVLYYWAAGISMRMFGVSEFSARLPSSLGALLAVLAVAWTALRSYGIGAAWYALLMLPTSVAMIGFSRAATPDMLFAGMLTAAMAVAAEMLQKSRPGPVLRVAFGFFLGAAVLAKGPAAVILVGGAMLLWAGLSRQWRAPFRFLHPLVIAAFCVAALPWYVLCAMRNPGFLRDFIWHHNFERYLAPVFEHPQPFWFFGVILLLAVIPWIWVFCTLLARIRLKKDAMNSCGALIGCWVAFTVFFFSLSQSKLPSYILPAIPLLFVLLGREVARSVERGKEIIWQIGATGLIFLVVGVVYIKPVLGIGPVLRVFDTSGIVAALSVYIVGGLCILSLTLLKRPQAALMGVVLLVTIVVGIANAWILPQTDRLFSPRELAQFIISKDSAASDVAEYKLPRTWKYGLNYYFQRELREWTPGSPQPDWIVTTPKSALEIQEGGIQVQEINPISAPTIMLLHVLRPEGK